MPLLFSYGTLQRPEVQLATFKRRLQGRADALSGFEPSDVPIIDPTVATALRATRFCNVRFNGRLDSRVAGMAYEVTDAELAAADDYERLAGYARTSVHLDSGRQAWVYLHDPAESASDAAG